MFWNFGWNLVSKVSFWTTPSTCWKTVGLRTNHWERLLLDLIQISMVFISTRRHLSCKKMSEYWNNGVTLLEMRQGKMKFAKYNINEINEYLSSLVERILIHTFCAISVVSVSGGILDQKEIADFVLRPLTLRQNFTATDLNASITRWTNAVSRPTWEVIVLCWPIVKFQIFPAITWGVPGHLPESIFPNPSGLGPKLGNQFWIDFLWFFSTQMFWLNYDTFCILTSRKFGFNVKILF